MLKVLYTWLVDFRRAPEPETIAPAAAAIPADAMQASHKGVVRRQALVGRKLGTIPEAEEIELPEVESSR